MKIATSKHDVLDHIGELGIAELFCRFLYEVVMQKDEDLSEEEIYCVFTGAFASDEQVLEAFYKTMAAYEKMNK